MPASSSAPASVALDGVGHLKRGVLGTGSLVFMVVAAAAPLTVMAGVAPLAILVGGIGAPVAYLASGVVLTVFAIAFTRMTKHVGSAGAFYAYIAKGLGRTWGLAAALLALMSYNALMIGVYGLFAVQAQATLADVFGVTVRGRWSRSSPSAWSCWWAGWASTWAPRCSASCSSWRPASCC